MAVSYMVRGSSRTECQRALEELCQLLGIVVTTPPTDSVGRGWVARAVMPAAPDDEVQGRVEA